MPFNKFAKDIPEAQIFGNYPELTEVGPRKSEWAKSLDFPFYQQWFKKVTNRKHYPKYYEDVPPYPNLLVVFYTFCLYQYRKEIGEKYQRWFQRVLENPVQHLNRRPLLFAERICIKQRSLCKGQEVHNHHDHTSCAQEPKPCQYSIAQIVFILRYVFLRKTRIDISAEIQTSSYDKYQIYTKQSCKERSD